MAEIPMRIVEVRAAIAAANGSGEGRYPSGDP